MNNKMVRFFVHPIQDYYQEQEQEPMSPYIILGIFSGFILVGFATKTMIVRLVRKHV